MLLAIAACTADIHLYLETTWESCSLVQKGGPGPIHCSAFCNASPLNVWRPASLLTFVGFLLSSTGQTGFHACGRRCAFAGCKAPRRLPGNALWRFFERCTQVDEKNPGEPSLDEFVDDALPCRGEEAAPPPVRSSSQKLFPRLTRSVASELSIAHVAQLDVKEMDPHRRLAEEEVRPSLEARPSQPANRDAARRSRELAKPFTAQRAQTRKVDKVRKSTRRSAQHPRRLRASLGDESVLKDLRFHSQCRRTTRRDFGIVGRSWSAARCLSFQTGTSTTWHAIGRIFSSSRARMATWARS